MTCIELGVIGQKLSTTLKSKNLAILAFKKIPNTPTKVADVKPSFRKVSLPHAKLRMHFPRIESFCHKSTPSEPLDGGLLSKVLASTKIGGPRMPKGQHSRGCHIAALWALQQPHKHSHSLQLANHTQLAHHYIQYALSTLSVLFLIQEDFFKVPHSHY